MTDTVQAQRTHEAGQSVSFLTRWLTPKITNLQKTQHDEFEPSVSDAGLRIVDDCSDASTPRTPAERLRRLECMIADHARLNAQSGLTP